ncbi:MAG: rhomboid family intramembrane serine protease [bacterium]|nr:rhomboid family intramembrane serine protease [bacterium]
MKHSIRDEIRGVLIFIGIIWAVFALDLILPGNFTNWGLTPRSLKGLVGIPLSPFLHGNWKHLLSNTIPLVILLTLLAGSRTRTWPTVAEIILLSGGLLWLFGRGGNTASGTIVHVGASGLIYGLIAFLIVAGFREKRFLPLLVAVLVGVLYGGTLLSGVLPSVGGDVSWDGHLCGALAGGGLAYLTLGPNAASPEAEV